jgi:hypothetical protein
MTDLPATVDDTEAARLLGVSVWSLREAAKAGRAPVTPIYIGRRRAWPTARLLGADGDGPPSADPVVVAAVTGLARQAQALADQAGELLAALGQRRQEDGPG